MNETNEDGLTFDRWLDRANTTCVRISGLGLNDLPDSCTYDAWEAGEDPAEHARQVLADEGFPFPEAPNPVGQFHVGTERRVHTNQRIDQALRARKVTGRMPILYR